MSPGSPYPNPPYIIRSNSYLTHQAQVLLLLLRRNLRAEEVAHELLDLLLDVLELVEEAVGHAIEPGLPGDELKGLDGVLRDAFICGA